MMTAATNHNLEVHTSIEDFVQALMGYYHPQEPVTDAVCYGYHNGWLAEQDVTGKKALLTRKTAARIIHNFMRVELKENDEPDSRPAQKLQDLYDCRSCVGHVTQTYLKGIIDGVYTPANRFIFGMEQFLSYAESNLIIKRLLTPSLRLPKPVSEDTLPIVQRISAEEAITYCRQDRKALLIDVRSASEFDEKHLMNAIHIPLMDILKNPYQVCEVRDRHILLYCNEGYQSDIAGNRLLECGFEKVSSFAINE